MLKKLIKKKQSGSGDMIACFFIVLGLSAVLLLCINFITDMFLIINIDQVARQGILLVETEGKLTSTDSEWIDKLLEGLGAKVIDLKVLVKDSSSNYRELTGDRSAGYGNVVTLSVKCRIPRTTIKGFSISREYPDADGDSGYIVRYKSSIAKY